MPVTCLVVMVFTIGFKAMDRATFKTWFPRDYKIKSPYIPEVVTYCGEPMPLDDETVRERLDKELMATVFWQSNTMMLLKRSKKYFPVIEAVLEEEHIPSDFKYLCVAESGLSNAVSPSGAKGFWQILEGTAKPYGLEINSFVDERYHLEKSTRAACAYFKEAYEIYKDWTLVSASYNRGMNGITRDLAYQGVKSFYDLHLNDETGRYIFRIAAYKLIFENPEQYGFYLKDEDYYNSKPKEVISVDTAISNLSTYAQSLGTNFKVLKACNPWLRDRSLPNKDKKVYKLEVPLE